MKKTIFLLLSLVVTMLSFGATIETNKTVYNVGESIEVTFTGSTAAKDWIGLYLTTQTPGSASPSIDWRYVNGTQSSTTVVNSGTITFNSGLSVAGDYKACFLANDGYTILAQVNFKVVEAKAMFSADPTLVAPGGMVNFTDLSTNNPTEWSWSFPGGTPSESTEQNPQIKYDTEGSYAVTLTATNAEGSKEVSIPNYITVSSSSSNTNLKVMQFNIWQEGTSVTNGMTYIKNVINLVNPDVVCFSEVRNYSGDWTTKIVNDLAAVGKTYYRGYVSGSDVSIISKFPITSSAAVVPLSNDQGSVVSFDLNVNGISIVVCSAHLDYTYYATYLPRGYACGGSGKYAGWDALSPFAPETDLNIISTQNLGSKRDEAISTFINHFNTETRPVLLLGDFNEPSCLDWTEKQANLYDHNGVVYEWNTTLSLKNAGFTDTYREVYPDEVLNPGITWPAVATNGGNSTSWAPLSDERDRLDYIFYKGEGVSAVSSAIVGPKASYVKNQASELGNGNDVFVASDLDWPSDHKGVVATLSIPSTNLDIDKVITSESLGIKIFPNPTRGNLSLVSERNINPKTIILNSAGQLMIEKSFIFTAGKSKDFDISFLPSGVYFLNFVDANKKQTIRFIKQ